MCNFFVYVLIYNIYAHLCLERKLEKPGKLKNKPDHRCRRPGRRRSYGDVLPDVDTWICADGHTVGVVPNMLQGAGGMPTAGPSAYLNSRRARW
jgi:hypothetical protein